MKQRILIFVLFILLLFIPFGHVKAFEDAVEIEENTPVFYLFSLEKDAPLNNIKIDISREKKGNISVFLFDRRPMTSYITPNQTLDDAIFSDSINFTESETPSLNVTASEAKIYYLEILIFANGSDILYVQSNRELSRYYLPSIPGFPLAIMLGTIIISVSVLFITQKRKLKTSTI
ncbi:MAG: conserved exported protein of unknown function [Promethearchaeota archaeon]|nr:MAG: conserved exported protein of unknown function [Candidatus Lokiarchaeota archaeon]